MLIDKFNNYYYSKNQLYIKTMSLGTPSSGDTLGSPNEPALALLAQKKPEEILGAWLDSTRRTPEKLQPHHAVSIELNFCADCTEEQFGGLANSLGQIVGIIPNINPGLVEKTGNVIILEARLFKGYEGVVLRYLRNFIVEWLNSEKNTFLLSIAVRHGGEDPMEVILSGEKPDIDTIPGYFEFYSQIMQRQIRVGRPANEEPTESIPDKHRAAIRKDVKKTTD